MLKTRQRRAGAVVLPNCDDTKLKSIRAGVHNKVSITVENNHGRYLVFRLGLRVKFISRSKMAATGLASDAG